MRLLGIQIPDDKHIEIALTYIYGIGPSLAEKILREAKVDRMKKAKDLQVDESNRIKKVIEANKIKVEGDLKREHRVHVKRLIDIKAYRGLRHMRRLPSRGQRTKTNARTQRGAKRTVGSGRKKAPRPT